LIDSIDADTIGTLLRFPNYSHPPERETHMRRATEWLGLVFLLLASPDGRADLLSGTVSYDPHTLLYTYSYAVTNTSSQGWLHEFDIRVGPAPVTLPGQALADPARPVAVTSPAGWTFNATVTFPSSYAGAGTNWSWVSAGIPTGTTVSGFSFTTPAPPAALVAGGFNSYGSFHPVPPPPGVPVITVIWQGGSGEVVAPALSEAQVNEFNSAPEPSALLLGVSACLVLAARVRRGRRSLSTPW
jgi:hypothetical protein